MDPGPDFDKLTTIEEDVKTSAVLSKLQPWADIIGTEEELLQKYGAA